MCPYFDMDDPHFGLHLSYVEPGDTHGVVAHTVKSGTMILAQGYNHHWLHRDQKYIFMGTGSTFPQSRRYDLAVSGRSVQDELVGNKVKVIFRRAET